LALQCSGVELRDRWNPSNNAEFVSFNQIFTLQNQENAAEFAAVWQ